MNKLRENSMSSEGEGSNSSQSFRLNPAVLGMPSSHGAKLPLMTSKDKKEFLERLEEWRKARKEKLAAKIFAKQKLPEKSKPHVNTPLPKAKTIFSSGGMAKNLNKESVFERLYKGNGKVKKSEVSDNSNKISELQNGKKSVLFPSNKAVKALEPDTFTDENSKLSTHEFIDGKNLNGFFHASSEIETSITIENSLITTDSTLKAVAQDAQNKQLQPLKSTVTEKPLKRSEEAISNLPRKTGVKVPSGGAKISMRRSISMSFRQKNKTRPTIRRSFSAKNIHELKKADNSSFKKSAFFRKNQATAESMYVVSQSKRLLPSTDLRTNLENWLKVNGHPLEAYRHLRCFGLENCSTPLRPTPSSNRVEDTLENLYHSTTPSAFPEESNKENLMLPTMLPQTNVPQIENWLKELHLLVSDLKYPSERCEEWLAAIKKKYSQCCQLPIYWECVAALNESKGEMKSTVDDRDERANDKGNEIESAENSLAKLFDQMVIEQKKLIKSKPDKGIDPKNIFKSTTIKFSLQHKTPKKSGPQSEQNIQEKLYIATPVRRSTRVQTPFKSNEVTSLGSLTPEVKKNLTFKPNQSLLEID